MLKPGNAPAPDTQIQKDNMKLAVTNIYPVFQKESEPEIRQEISAKLYQIFRKYDASYVKEGKY